MMVELLLVENEDNSGVFMMEKKTLTETPFIPKEYTGRDWVTWYKYIVDQVDKIRGFKLQ